MVWVAGRGFASAANRAYLTRGGGHYIHAEKLRYTNSEAAAALARPGRYRTVAGNLRVNEVAVAPGGQGDGDEGARTQRCVVCHNPEQAERDAAVRQRLVTHPRDADRRLRQLVRPPSGRARREPEDQARAAPLPAPHPRRPAPRRCRGGQARGASGRQVAATHLRHHPHRGGSGRRLQAAAAGRTGLAGHEGRARPAAGVPLPRGPHPRPRPAVLARGSGSV
jgi:hypothetical protein